MNKLILALGAMVCLSFADPLMAAVVINNISVSAIKTDSVIIRWDAASPGTSVVEYGPTDSYGSSVTDDYLASFHSQRLTGLSAGTLYHYRIKTKDYAGLETVSADSTFSTRQQSELETIIRNARADNGLAKTYYVSTSGVDDPARGTTEALAWRTISYAVSRSDVGDTIYVLPGTWSNEHIVFPKSGLDAANITVQAFGTAPVIDGIDQTGYCFYIDGKSNITISGFNIKNYNMGVLINRSSHCIINNVEVGFTSGQGVMLADDVHYCIVDSCTVHDTGWNSIMIYGDPQYVARGSTRNIIKNCETYNDGHGSIDVHTNVQYTNLVNNIVHRDAGVGNGGIYIHNYDIDYTSVIDNVAYNCYWAVLVASGSNCVVEGNVLHDNSRGINLEYMYNAIVRGNSIYSSDNGTNKYGGIGIFLESRNNQIMNNTIFGNGGDGILIDQNYPNFVKNNIIANNNGYAIAGGNAAVVSYNDLWNNTSGRYSGVGAGTGDIYLDPLFADSGAADFHLKSQYGRWNGASWVYDAVTSPCIDAGDPGDDYSKETQGNGGRINMGAYGNTPEASRSSIVSAPPGDLPPGEINNENPPVYNRVDIIVYPNPYKQGKNNDDKITFANMPVEAKLRIYNCSGELVKEISGETGGKTVWNVSDVGSGVYIYMASSPEGIKKGKVVVIK